MQFNKMNLPELGGQCVTKEEVPEAFMNKEKPIHSAGLLHLNSNIMCSIAILTTGPQADEHDIIQIAVLPLDSYISPMKGIFPFYTDIRPERMLSGFSELKTRHKEMAMEAAKNGLEPTTAQHLFTDWFDKLKLNPGKKIVPLCHDWPIVRSFFVEWLGPIHVDQMFDIQYRDIQASASYLNDLNDFHGERAMFGRVTISSLSRYYQVEDELKTNTLQRSLTIAEVYRRMLRNQS